MDGKRPTVASVHGIVAAAHPLAAQAGAKLLAQGGNAFDAAAATTAALNVVEPYMSGLAGMGMATCYIAAEKRIRTLDFITLVPEKFPVGRFKQREDIYRGPLAAAVPEGRTRHGGLAPGPHTGPLRCAGSAGCCAAARTRTPPRWRR